MIESYGNTNSLATSKHFSSSQKLPCVLPYKVKVMSVGDGRVTAGATEGGQMIMEKPLLYRNRGKKDEGRGYGFY